MSYNVRVGIRGTAPILQHKFGAAVLEELMKGANKKSGSTDYRLEWLETMYAAEGGFIYQPAAHIEGSLVQAGKRFTVKGQGKKTYKDLLRAYVYVSPEEIPFLWDGNLIPTPDENLMQNPTEALSVSVMRVKVQTSAVARMRLQVAAGWELQFTMDVIDDQLRPEVLHTILEESGRAVGIGDFRPRFGRFVVKQFDVEEATA